MALAVPSRFACLKIEDDDYRPKSSNKPKQTNTNNKSKKVENNKINVKTKKGTPTTLNSVKQQINKNTNSKTNKNVTNNNKKVTQNTNKTNPNTNTNKSSQKKKKDVDQWEKWKEKDMQLVDGKFEDDLQNAILLSKLDYEEKKEFYQQNKKEAELAEKSKENKKTKKKKAMSLEQFNNMCDGKDGKKVQAEDLKLSNGIKAEFDDSFFERVNCEAREEIQREQSKQIRKAREPYNDAVTIAQFQAELDKLRAENLVLRQELESARTDIVHVKTRNKKLCSLLGQGEMREKAEILLEVERLQRVQTELTSEVTRLHAELEQERSKSTAFTHDSKHKEKNKKRPNNDGTHQQSK